MEIRQKVFIVLLFIAITVIVFVYYHFKSSKRNSDIQGSSSRTTQKARNSSQRIEQTGNTDPSSVKSSQTKNSSDNTSLQASQTIPDKKTLHKDKKSQTSRVSHKTDLQNILNDSKVKEKLAYYEKLMAASVDFEKTHREYPLRDNLSYRIVQRSPDPQTTKMQIVEHAQGVQILLDERAAKVIEAFLKDKQTNGNLIEMDIYKNMKFDWFIDRLLRKRPLTFYKPEDKTILRFNPKAVQQEMHDEWLKVGKPGEVKPMIMRFYMTYEEMELSALINVSVPTFFINKGNRKNMGIPGTKGTFVEEGILIAGVGARFALPELMEGKYMLHFKNKSKNLQSLPLFWRDLYDLNDSSKVQNRLKSLNSNIQLDTKAYTIRLELTLKPILLHAEAEGKKRNRKIFLRLAGFGLGLWAVDKDQSKTQAKIYVDSILLLLSELSFIQLEAVELQYLLKKPNELVQCAGGKQISVIYADSNPADPLPLEFKDCFLVATYAWDGNSFPGNEYWAGGSLIGESGDSAAAACSTICEWQNPYVNEDIKAKDRLIIYH